MRPPGLINDLEIVLPGNSETGVQKGFIAVGPAMAQSSQRAGSTVIVRMEGKSHAVGRRKVKIGAVLDNVSVQNADRLAD